MIKQKNTRTGDEANPGRGMWHDQTTGGKGRGRWEQPHGFEERATPRADRGEDRAVNSQEHALPRVGWQLRPHPLHG